MAKPEASCNNQDCDKDVWKLTKPPDQYSRGWPTCPECGTTDVSVEGQNKGEIQTVEQEQESQGELVSGGEQIAGAVAGATDESLPMEERTQAVTQGAQLLGGMVSGLMKYNKAKQERANQYSKNVGIEKANDKPTCECGYTFTIQPGQERIQCPNCGIEYKVS